MNDHCSEQALCSASLPCWQSHQFRRNPLAG